LEFGGYKRERGKLLQNNLLQLFHTHGYIFLQRQVVFICQVAIDVQVAFFAEHYVRGFWVFGCYGDRVGVGPVAAFRGGYVVKAG